MKFPESRTEILDKIAGIAVKARDESNGGDISNEAKREIRFALMFWNDVENKSLPDATYDGLDVDLMGDINPARIFDRLDFVSGCEDYQAERYEHLLVELNKIESEMYKDKSFSPMEHGKITELCDNVLGNDYNRQEIINSLSDLGYTMMDRKLTFEFDNAGYSFDDIGLSRENIIATMKDGLEFSGLSDTVDIRVQPVYFNEASDAHKMQLQVWHNGKNSVEVMDLVTNMIKAKIKEHDTDMDYTSVAMTSEYISGEIPGYKDAFDFHKRDRAKRAYEAEKSASSLEM